MLVYKMVDKFFNKLNIVVEKLFGSYRELSRRLPDGSVKYQSVSRAHLHWQNLNDRKSEHDTPYHGRCWLRIHGTKDRNLHTCFEWNLWNPRWLYNFRVELKNNEDVTIAFGIWPFSFYITLENFFNSEFNRWWFNHYKYESRRIWFYAVVSDSITSLVDFRCDLWSDWVKGSTPSKIERLLNFSFPDIIMDPVFGPIEHKNIIEDTADIKIPMPEGNYSAKAKITTSIWKRPRVPWLSHIRKGAWADIPGGIPHGDNGVYGMGVDQPSYQELIIKIRNYVLNKRGYNRTCYPDPESGVTCMITKVNK